MKTSVKVNHTDICWWRVSGCSFLICSSWCVCPSWCVGVNLPLGTVVSLLYGTRLVGFVGPWFTYRTFYWGGMGPCLFLRLDSLTAFFVTGTSSTRLHCRSSCVTRKTVEGPNYKKATKNRTRLRVEYILVISKNSLASLSEGDTTNLFVPLCSKLSATTLNSVLRVLVFYT